MIDTGLQTTSYNPDLVAKMTESNQLSVIDAGVLERACAAGKARAGTEEEVLLWLAGEYNLAYEPLDKLEPDRALLGRFPGAHFIEGGVAPHPAG